MNCEICSNIFESDEIKVIQGCNHKICQEDLHKYITELIDNGLCEISCPVPGCLELLKDSLIRQIVSTDYEDIYEQNSLNQVKPRHNCLLKECRHIVIYEDENIQYDCKNCGMFNCIKCKRIHKMYSCSQFEQLSISNQQTHEQRERTIALNKLDAKRREIQLKSLLVKNKSDILKIKKPFSCQMCCKFKLKDQGICLRNCRCIICKLCLKDYLVTATSIPVKCPICDRREMHDREILKILNRTDLINKYRQKILAITSNIYRCMKPDCTFQCYVDYGISHFKCRICGSNNYLMCNNLHLQTASCLGEEPEIKKQIANHELMRCPDCKILLHRATVCGWIQCSNCGTELCWWRQTYFRGPYGCVCNPVDSCHPKCNLCAPHKIMNSTNKSPSNNGMNPKVIPKDAEVAKKRIERRERERIENERKERERLENERKKRERIENERKERERIENERRENKWSCILS